MSFQVHRYFLFAKFESILIKAFLCLISDFEILTGDIYNEVESHNRMLDRTVWGIMSGTMDRFNMVLFEKKSSRKTCGLVACFVVLSLYYTILSGTLILIYITYGSNAYTAYLLHSI
ncbi:hypothetical protein DCAR_0726877 [Daucus carota subsp. sativus]|uniref:Uncharacterized protein n=1 Tax=Daucus carota subsp. sativus TaxID=79200 RepID=A0AAF1B868_DAUCS|nr:hypothetical protein DCAR_0726877 [Daucus carota subsp. sativus]